MDVDVGMLYVNGILLFWNKVMVVMGYFLFYYLLLYNMYYVLIKIYIK